MLKVGLAGAGSISDAHITAWEAMEDVKLTALCDVRKECLIPYADKACYLSFEEMLNKEKLDILDICLPTPLHVDCAVTAMKRGIHVICEKPLSLKTEEIERAYLTAHQYGVCFMTAQVLRFWPEYELLKDLYVSGQYGRLLSGSMQRIGPSPKGRPGNWMLCKEQSGLVPFDLHIHDLDFIFYAFGAPSGFIPHRAKRADQDYLSVVYEFPDFFITAESSWYAAPYPFTAGYRFQFEKAVIAYEGGVCKIYQNDGTILNLSDGSAPAVAPVLLEKGDAYAREIRYFTDCVKTGSFPNKVTPEELCAVATMLNQL